MTKNVPLSTKLSKIEKITFVCKPSILRSEQIDVQVFLTFQYVWNRFLTVTGSDV